MVQLVTCAMLSSSSPLLPWSRQGAAEAGGSSSQSCISPRPAQRQEPGSAAAAAAKDGAAKCNPEPLGEAVAEQGAASGDHCWEGWQGVPWGESGFWRAQRQTCLQLGKWEEES